MKACNTSQFHQSQCSHQRWPWFMPHQGCLCLTPYWSDPGLFNETMCLLAAWINLLPVCRPHLWLLPKLTHLHVLIMFLQDTSPDNGTLESQELFCSSLIFYFFFASCIFWMVNMTFLLPKKRKKKPNCTDFLYLQIFVSSMYSNLNKTYYPINLYCIFLAGFLPVCKLTENNLGLNSQVLDMPLSLVCQP